VSSASARFADTAYRRVSYLCGLALMLFCGPLLASPDVPPEYAAAIERAEWLGTALYVHDAAAASATDELGRRGALNNDPRIRGWITAMPGNSDAVLVTFVGPVDGTPHALYRVTVPPENRALHYEKLNPPLPLTSAENASYAARTLAIAEFSKEEQRCSKAYNSVVLPIQRQGDPFILVYLLAATDQPGVIVAGGHLRYEVSPDGKKIEGKRTFTNSCMVIPPPSGVNQDKIAAVTLTHLLDPTPTEIHVFMSRLYNKPFFIGTPENDRVWKVDGRSIRLMDSDKK
jgi:hypothetical protein